MSDSLNNFIAEFYDPKVSSWENIKDKIFFIEQEAFGDKAFSTIELSKDFQDKKNTVILLKQPDSGFVVGFTYAEPLDIDTAYICDTVIQKDFRNKGLIKILMDCLEEELKNRGYKYIEREVVIGNDYANNIMKHYKDRIVKQSEPHESTWGSQIRFRIKL